MKTNKIFIELQFSVFHIDFYIDSGTTKNQRVVKSMEPVEIDPIILFVRAITGFNIKALNLFNNVFLSYLKVCIILITFYTKYLVASQIKTVFKFVIN